jgi:hypothetical protein
MIINSIYEHQNLVAVACFFPGRAKDLSAPLYTTLSFRFRLVTVSISQDTLMSTESYTGCNRKLPVRDLVNLVNTLRHLLAGNEKSNENLQLE